MLSRNIERHHSIRDGNTWYRYIQSEVPSQGLWQTFTIRWLYLHSRTHFAALADNNKTLRHISCKSFRRFDTCHHLFYVRVPYMCTCNVLCDFSGNVCIGASAFLYIYICVAAHCDVVAVTMALKIRLHTQMAAWVRWTEKCRSWKYLSVKYEPYCLYICSFRSTHIATYIWVGCMVGVRKAGFEWT